MNSRLLQTLKLGVKSLLLHKLRSALAILGILIGVTAVIWLVALGEGVSHQAQEQIKELGATNIIIRTVKPPSNSGMASAFFLAYGVLRNDFERISQTIPSIVKAVPLREITKEVRYNDRTSDARIVGCTPEYPELNRLEMARGRFIDQEDQSKKQNFCVLAHESASNLFPFSDPIGASIQIETDFYTVIGVTRRREASGGIGGSLTGQDYNKDIYIPLETLRARIGDQVLTAKGGSREGEIVELSQITASVGHIDEVEDAAEQIRILMKKFHANEDYSVIVPQELLHQAEVVRMMFNLLLILIAGISLLVGGIGIMNIMLATVTERTREIGIRRALGAKRRDIIQQFLSETVVLSSLGGFLGVVLGLSCQWAIPWAKQLIEKFAQETWTQLPPIVQKLEPRIATWSVLAAFFISVGVGVIFGLYPAQRAAMMDPIDALRHE